MYRQLLDTNVVGPFLVALALLPSLRKKESRTIVQVGHSCPHCAAVSPHTAFMRTRLQPKPNGGRPH